MIAQFKTPSEGLSTGYYQPLLLAGFIYVVIFLVARVLEGREDKRAAGADDIAFAVLLLAGAYVVILTIVALVSEFELVGDMLTILVVIVAFFGLLVMILLAVFEQGIGGLSRLRKRAGRS